MRVTIYESMRSKKPHHITIEQALNRIKDGKSRQLIDRIRAGEDLKETLPCVIFAGEVHTTTRKDGDVSKHSGVFVLDFDHVDAEQKKNQLINDHYIYAAWVSPSGDGVKALVRCTSSIEKHEELYIAFSERYPELDTTSKNISRLCFESYDPKIYINPRSKIWERTKTEAQVAKERAERKDRRNVQLLGTAVAMVRSSVDGEKHDELLKAARLLGGYVAAGRIDEQDAITTLETEIKLKQPKNLSQAKQTIKDGIEYGKKAPLHEAKKIEKAQEFLRRDDGEFAFMASKEEMDAYEQSVIDGTLAMGLSSNIPELDKYWMFKYNSLDWFSGLDNSGKAQPLTSNILTPKGWVKMGDIKVGDDVIGSDGKPKKVLGVFPQGKKQVWEVEFSDGTVVECCKDHLWTSVYSSTKEVTRTTEYMHRGYLTPDGNKSLYRVKLVNPIEYQEVELPLDPYHLGVLIGDGSLTTHKFVPEIYKRGSIEQRRNLIRGLVDTVGHICGSGFIEYSTKSKQLGEDFVDICRSLGARVVVKDKVVNGEVYQKIHVEDFDGVLFSSKKHTSRYMAPRGGRYKTITRIEPTERIEEQQCILIDSPDHLYVTDGYTLTHNTFILWYLAVIEAMFNGITVLIGSFENNDGELRKKLKEFYLGKPIKEFTHEERKMATDFIDKHFKLFSSKHLYTWDEFIIRAEVIYDEGFEFDLLIAEPFNAMDIPAGLDEHRHNLKSTNMLRVFKESFSSVWVADHVNSSAGRNKDKDGYIKVPWKSDVSGGQIKANKADSFCVVHRILNDPERKYLTELHVQKIRSKETGGEPTNLDEPVLFRINKNYCGYTCGGVDPVAEYWAKKTGQPIQRQEPSIGGWHKIEGDAPF